MKPTHFPQRSSPRHIQRGATAISGLLAILLACSVIVLLLSGFDHKSLRAPYWHVAWLYEQAFVGPARVAIELYSSINALALTPWPNANLLIALTCVAALAGVLFMVIVALNTVTGGLLLTLFLGPAAFALAWLLIARSTSWLFQGPAVGA